MQYKFNPPPNWPPVKKGYRPPPGWVAPEEWGPPPEGWQLWVPERSIWTRPGMIAAYGVLAVVFLLVGVVTDGTAPSATPVTSPTATPGAVSETEPADETTEPADETTAATEPPAEEPTSYDVLTTRQWKRIVKDPDAHIGEGYVVFGQVTQFDAATGADTFLADVGPVRDSCSYGFCDYPTNTLLTGDEQRLEKAVEDDVFRAKVVVLGSIDYETQIGGETTAPLLEVYRLKILSSP